MIAKNHAPLSRFFRITTPDWDTSKWALDKRLTYQRAASLGIDCPRTFYPRSRLDLPDLGCRFPVVLKPSSRHAVNAFTLAKAWQAGDLASLMRRYDQASSLVGADEIVLQEMIPGGGERQYSYAAVWNKGHPVASLVARRARQYPINFGFTSTLVQSVDCPQVEETGARFLKSLDYHGIAEVEFKYDAGDDRYKILDVNARAWTWIALGEAAGADFPFVLWQVAMGQPVVPARGRSGATWMHVSRDLVAACQETAVGRITPAGYLASFRRPLTFAAFAADDPLPGIMDLPLLASRLLTRRLPGFVRRIALQVAKRCGNARALLLGRHNGHRAY
ncbi:MAG TPA: ATP-grasp domain-containing protein [Pseudolabrys sp.]|nr:ATP-grasp domain-containing protein [Pseudolabrys sp.]